MRIGIFILIQNTFTKNNKESNFTDYNKHECSCGDKEINHAHEFPELGCICLTCRDEDEVVFDEDVIHGFDHVRGSVEQRELIVLYLKTAIKIIKHKRG